MKTNIWLVAAESNRARVFTAENSNSPLIEIEQLERPDIQNVISHDSKNRPGKSYDSHGHGNHPMAGRIDHKTQDSIRFAKQLAQRVEKARLQDGMRRLVIIAPPAFLGLIRSQLSQPAKKLVVAEIPKNIIQRTPEDIRSAAPKWLPDS